MCCSHGAGSTRDDRRSRTTVMEMCSGQHLTSTSAGDVSGLVASGAVYFGQLDPRSRRTSAYVTTRAFVPFIGPVYVTTGSIRVTVVRKSRHFRLRPHAGPVGHRTLVVHKSRPRGGLKKKRTHVGEGRSDLLECGRTAGTCLNCGERVSCVRVDISL